MNRDEARRAFENEQRTPYKPPNDGRLGKVGLAVFRLALVLGAFGEFIFR